MELARVRTASGGEYCAFSSFGFFADFEFSQSWTGIGFWSLKWVLIHLFFLPCDEECRGVLPVPRGVCVRECSVHCAEPWGVRTGCAGGFQSDVGFDRDLVETLLEAIGVSRELRGIFLGAW